MVHVVVRRVSGTIEAENEGAAPFGVRDLGVGDPFSLPLGLRRANEAVAVVLGFMGGGHLEG